jgi:hypothetical protein
VSVVSQFEIGVRFFLLRRMSHASALRQRRGRDSHIAISTARRIFASFTRQ